MQANRAMTSRRKSTADRGFAPMYIMAAAQHANLSNFDALFIVLRLICGRETLYTK